MRSQKWLFVACIVSLVATSFGFVSRALLLSTLGEQFNLSQQQKGSLSGAGLFPFALSIIFFSLIIDRIGYGWCMLFAWLGHMLSAIIMITASSFTMLYAGTLLLALANGTVEAVVNPATASLFPKNKTHYLNILHAGWPGGLVLGGLLFVLLPDSVSWKVKMVLYLIPTLVYGILMLGQRFPVQERVTAGVSFTDMLKEFGWGGCFIVSYFVVLAFDSVFTSLEVYQDSLSPAIAAAIAIVPTVLFALRFRSFGQPLFVFLLLIMVLLATTELGTDSWVADMMKPVFHGSNAGNLVLIYTSAIMLVLRFSAGPILHRVSPLGLLTVCAALASIGLFSISRAGSSTMLVFAAATLYGAGKSFFWPTTLGVVSERFPRGGAMTLNAMGGMGMIAVGVLGGPFLGALQDHALDHRLQQQSPAVYARVAGEEKTAYLMTFRPIDERKLEALPAQDKQVVESVKAENSQATLAQVALLPATMFVCYVALLLYFRSKGGYRPVQLEAGGG